MKKKQININNHYAKKINGFHISITKDVLPDGEIVWYNSLYYNGNLITEGTDFYPAAKQAKEAIVYVANHPEEYDILKP